MCHSKARWLFLLALILVLTCCTRQTQAPIANEQKLKVDSLLIVRDGHIVDKAYLPPFEQDDKHELMINSQSLKRKEKIMFNAIRKSLNWLGQPFAARQKEKEEKRLNIDTYYTAFEAPESAMSEMQTLLEDQGYQFSQAPQGGGGGLLLKYRRLVIDANGLGMGGVDDNKSAFNYGQGSLSLGYTLAQKAFLRIYPLVGIGGAGGVTTTHTDDGGIESAEVSNAMINLGLGIDFQIKFWRLGALVGLRLGVRLRGKSESEWYPQPYLNVITGPSLNF